MIQLIGPGGAGKSTAARLIAERLGCPFHDLDRQFESVHGDIDRFLDRRGYEAYASANIDVYITLDLNSPGVLAMSSGFMTYPDRCHPALPALKRAIESSPAAVVLLPSVDLEVCVTETVRRQRERGLPGRRSDTREAEVIRERFPVYRALGLPHVETMQSPTRVAIAVIESLRRVEAQVDGDRAMSRPAV